MSYEMKFLLILSIFVLFFFAPQISYEHQDGCHRWHSCPSDSGSYTCGDTGNCSECNNNQYCQDRMPRSKSVTAEKIYNEPLTKPSIEPTPPAESKEISKIEEPSKEISKIEGSVVSDYLVLVGFFGFIILMIALVIYSIKLRRKNN